MDSQKLFTPALTLLDDYEKLIVKFRMQIKTSC